MDWWIVGLVDKWGTDPAAPINPAIHLSNNPFKMVGSGGKAPLVVFPDLFCDDRFTVGCGERRPEQIRNPNDAMGRH